MKGPKVVSSSYVRIWRTVLKIPRGRISTYGTVAELSGLPGAARLVGYALHNLPNGSDVPWHRVINSKGKISFEKSQDMYLTQRRMLREEDVVFENEKVNLWRYGWPRVGGKESKRARSKR